MEISNVIFETTRRCNMACKHCLRGDAEELVLSREYIDTFMEKVSLIANLTITGGEPSLEPEVILDIVDSSIIHNVEIQNFYIATNAHCIDNDFVLAVAELYMTCTDNSVSLLHWSNDAFHEIDPEAVMKLEMFSFANAKYHDSANTKDNRMIIPEGRGAKFGKGLPLRDWGFDTEIEYVLDGEVYLNCLGEIISGCDWSYETQQEHKVCDVIELSPKTLEKYDPNKVEWKGDYETKSKVKSKKVKKITYVPTTAAATGTKNWYDWVDDEQAADESAAVSIKRVKQVI